MCNTPTGACCVLRVCTDDVLESACASDKWFKGAPCDDPEVAEHCAEQPLPTVSHWGLIVTALLLLAGAKVYFGRWWGTVSR